MKWMEEINEAFFKASNGEKAIFSSYISRKHKRMYDWLRAVYPDSPITIEIQRAITEKIEAINRAAPKRFEDAG